VAASVYRPKRVLTWAMNTFAAIMNCSTKSIFWLAWLQNGFPKSWCAINVTQHIPHKSCPSEVRRTEYQSNKFPPPPLQPKPLVPSWRSLHAQSLTENPPSVLSISEYLLWQQSNGFDEHSQQRNTASALFFRCSANTCCKGIALFHDTACN
jgi:hypothetical protein